MLQFNRATPWCVLLALSFIAAVPAANAQVLKAQILGSVADTSGAVIPAARITLTDTSTGVVRRAETNESGNYVFVNLDAGIYSVAVEQEGFAKAVRNDIDLRPNTTARVNFELQPGAVTETIDVTATAVPLLQTDRADTGGKLETRQLQNMPLLYNRNYQGLLLLVPGVGKPFRPHSEFYNSQDSLSVRVNGQGRQYNNFQIEGIENKIDNGNLTALVPPAEAIQTVDMSTSNFDPEFGNAGGAIVNVTLRSGTNDFHGSLFEFHRNENIQARNTFAKTKAPTVYNQFGGTFGGPIKRNKMFFFGDFQGSRDRLGQVNRVVMPRETFRTGNLSASPTPIYDPLTGDSTGAGRTQFPGNIIPSSRINPISQKILGFLPNSNVAGAEGQISFDRNTVRVKDLNQVDTKYDWVIGQNDRISGRYSLQKAFVSDPGLFGPEGGIYGGPHNGGFSGTGPARTQSAGITYSRVFSPTFVWESRIGLVRNRNDALNQDHGLTTAKDIGIKGANVDDWSSGMSYIQINGYSEPVVGFSPSLPWARSVTSYGIVNNFTKTFTSHIVRFGADFRRERNDLLQTQTFNPRGRFYFEPGQTSIPGGSNGFANAFASFLLDVPNRAGRDLAIVFPARREFNQNYYVQDKWQINSKLTIDLGVRYEIQSPSTPRFPGGFSNYNYFNNTLELAGLGSIPMDQGVKKQWNNIAPRLGVAFRANDKTVFRGGYGVSFIPRRTAQFNYPITQNNEFNSANAFVPTNVTMSAGFPAAIIFQIPSDGIIKNPDPKSSFNNTPQDLKVAKVESWNFAIQRALPWHVALDLAYVGNRGVNNQTDWNVNAAQPGTGLAGRPLNQQFGRQADTTTSIGTPTWYHSMQAKVERRFQQNLLLTTAYTWSKGINYTDDIGGLAIPINIPINKGRMSDNRTHVFTQSFMWTLPVGKGQQYLSSGWAGAIVGGWQVQGVLSYMSGTWFSPSAAAATLNAPGNSQRPDWISPVNYLNNIGPGEYYFDIRAFAIPKQNTLGNAGRNILQGPGISNLDASIFRNFQITERFQLTFRAEAFNSTNTPHFDNPSGNINSPQFGTVTSAAQDQRQFQFGLTLRF